MKFIDFCAGIGGGREGLERVGFEAIGFSEINSKAEMVYRTLHDTSETNFGDLMKINPSDLPDFDLLIAGFPCQSFSILGKRKGLEDERGQVISGIINILKCKLPKFFILENVKGLVNIENGNVLEEILKNLEEIGYDVKYKVLNSVLFGVPQKRERIYFVGSLKSLKLNYEFPQEIKQINACDFLTPEEKHLFNVNDTFLNYLKRNNANLDTLLQEENLIIDARQSDLRLYRGSFPTIRNGRQGLFYVKQNKLYKLSGKQALQLQGFELNKLERLKNCTETNLLSLAGNAMTANVIEKLAKNLL